jgi:hypothetical protein
MKACVLILSTMLLLCLAGCSRPSRVEAPPHTDYVLSDGGANAGCAHFHQAVDFAHWSFAITHTYRVGMSRQQIAAILGPTDLVSTRSRPQRGWRSMPKDEYGVSWPADGFESCHADCIIASCDIYRSGKGWHILFFDSMGVLVGSDQMPDSNCIINSCLS